MHKNLYNKKEESTNNQQLSLLSAALFLKGTGFARFVLKRDWIRSLRSRIQVPLLESTNNQQQSKLHLWPSTMIPKYNFCFLLFHPACK
jgi:hypothetical protein